MVRKCKCGCKEVRKEHYPGGDKNFKNLRTQAPLGNQMVRTFVHCKCCNTLLGTYRHWGDYE